MRCKYCHQEMDDGQHFRCWEPKMTGTIKSVIVDKGYGFIKDNNGGEFFFHMSGLRGCHIGELQPGMKVEFDTVRSPKGLRAENVRMIED